YQCWGYHVTFPKLLRRQLAQYLLWDFSANFRRRREFPSWSWLGWNGEFSFPEKLGRNLADAKFWVGRKDNTLMPLETVKDAVIVTKDLEQLSLCLHIEATTLPIQLAEFSGFELNDQ